MTDNIVKLLKNKSKFFIVLLVISIFLLLLGIIWNHVVHSVLGMKHTSFSSVFGHGSILANKAPTNSMTNEQIKNSFIIRVDSSEGTEMFSKNMIDRISRLVGVQDVYPFLSLQNNFGNILGIDVNKPGVLEAEGKLVIPQMIEGRFLNEEDKENVMIVGVDFAKSNKTDRGYPILGSLTIHPKVYNQDDVNVTLVGIFIEETMQLSNTLVLPIDSIYQLFFGNEEKGVNRFYVLLDPIVEKEEIIEEISNIIDDKGIIEVISNPKSSK